MLIALLRQTRYVKVYLGIGVADGRKPQSFFWAEFLLSLTLREKASTKAGCLSLEPREQL